MYMLWHYTDIYTMALGVGGDITSTFDHPEQTKLGECKLIEEITIGEDRLIHFSGVAKAEACTIVLRGASDHSHTAQIQCFPAFSCIRLHACPCAIIASNVYIYLYAWRHGDAP